MNNDDSKDYNNLPNDTMVKNPVEVGEVAHQNDEVPAKNMGQAQDVNNIPDSPLVDENIEEVNDAIEDTAEEA
jgi:hypothetical protein